VLGGKRREIENANAPALEGQCVAAPHFSPVPTEREQHDCANGDTAQARLDGQVGVLSGIAQQECDTKEEHDDADTDDEVAASEEFANLPQGRELIDLRGCRVRVARSS
jgi:hypothetical protein